MHMEFSKTFSWSADSLFNFDISLDIDSIAHSCRLFLGLFALNKYCYIKRFI